MEYIIWEGNGPSTLYVHRGRGYCTGSVAIVKPDDAGFHRFEVVSNHLEKNSREELEYLLPYALKFWDQLSRDDELALVDVIISALSYLSKQIGRRNKTIKRLRKALEKK